MMDMRRLGYFVRIAEDGSLTKAAGVLRIAQPALSRQVRLLEQELGVVLFRRTARGMQLTQEGEYLRASVAGPLRSVELALQNVRSYSSLIEGNFTVGMPSSIGDMLSASLVRRLYADFPNIKLRIVEGITGSLIDWLHRGMLDFALLEEAARDERLTDREIYAEKLLLVGAADSTLNARRATSLRNALRQPLIVPTHHLGIRGILNDAIAKLRLSINIRFEADSSKLIKDLVASGLGYAILPMSYFRQEFLAGKLNYSPLVQPALSLRIFSCYRTNSRATTSRVEALIVDTLLRMMKAPDRSAP